MLIASPVGAARAESPYLVVLGVAQDGGVPQAGTREHQGWNNPDMRRLVSCLGLVDPESSQRWLLDCTPDFPEQLHRLDEIAPVEGRPGLAGIFLTHGHIGHYTGLMFLGHESLGASGVAVYAMPKMTEFLSSNGPWDQLVRYNNISLRPLANSAPIRITPTLTVTPFVVPHRQEYTEVVGFIISGPDRSALFIPDIDSWEQLDTLGVSIEELIAGVDVAYLDGTFYDNGEIPGRDMSGFPHPFIAHSMKRFASLPDDERAKIRFLHFNHTNPALWPESDARKQIRAKGFTVAEELEQFRL